MKLPKIQTLRQKSKAARNNIAFGVACTFTAVVFAVWILVDPSGISESVTAVPTDQPRMFGGLIDQIKEQVAGAQQAFETDEQVPEETTRESDVIIPPIPTEPEFSTATNSQASTTGSTTPREVQLFIDTSATTTPADTSGRVQ